MDVCVVGDIESGALPKEVADAFEARVDAMEVVLYG